MEPSFVAILFTTFRLTDRPEVIEALASGKGLSTRHSDTLNQDLVYMAIRNQLALSEPVVLRLAPGGGPCILLVLFPGSFLAGT